MDVFDMVSSIFYFCERLYYGEEISDRPEGFYPG